MTPREDTIAGFLAAQGWGDADRTALAGDASARRYLRLRRGTDSALLMDSPNPAEDVVPFVAISRLLQGLGLSAPDILAGDYNIIPTERDVYNPDRWGDDALFLPEVRKAYASLLKQGWCDAIATIHPDKPVYTFWDYLRQAWERNAGLRLDHLLLSPGLAARLKDADIDRDMRGRPKASDHAPAWIVIDMK